MSLITVLIGISGSGKTTFSTPLLKDKNTIRVNRDDARTMLFGVSQSDQTYYNRKDIRACEDLVSETIEDIVYNALNKGKNIIFDNTHLQKKYIDEILFKFNHLADIELVFCDVALKEAQDRVVKRNSLASVPVYIEKHYNDYIKLKKSMHGQQLYYPQTAPQVKFNSSLPDTYLYDIDGNLAKKGDRDIFDDSKLHLDTEIVEVGNVLRGLYKAGYKVIFLSGRQDSCKESTTQWLKDNNLWMPDSEIYMRKAKDQRKDSIVKEELLMSKIIPKYNVIAVFDDREQVVRNWHKLGVFCFNTNQNNVKF